MKYTEELLEAWLRLSTVLRNERYVETMTFNEILILRALAKQHEINKEAPYLQAKELCDKTYLLKSAINKILNDLENKGYIERIRFRDNRKNVYVQLTNNALNYYDKEHNKINEIVNEVIEHLGEEDTLTTIQNLNKVSEVIEKIWLNKKEEK